MLVPPQADLPEGITHAEAQFTESPLWLHLLGIRHQEKLLSSARTGGPQNEGAHESPKEGAQEEFQQTRVGSPGLVKSKASFLQVEDRAV